MKKFNSILHDEKVQGTLFLAFIFIALIVILALTWGK
jgi:hypothetical protein